MNKQLIINASPRQNGTSKMLCRRMQKELGAEVRNLFDTKTDIQELIDAIDKADTIVIAGPCYINSYPAKVTLLLEELEKQPEKCHGQKLYGIINGGMPYVHTHEAGVRLLELFCDSCNMHYAGGFVFGLGAALNGQELETHMYAKKVVPAFEAFTEHIKNGEDSPRMLYTQAEKKVKGLLAGFLAFLLCRSNNKMLREHGFDYSMPSPYRKL